ncbi:hypothetical protein ABZY06_24760 [Streptomyces sp. NPDC006540]|uniref:hypothetical protein n=1 Tax=Streptomyces sp. NPDC006540 TaxID=3155353 RepID=UPI0033B92418
MNPKLIAADLAAAVDMVVAHLTGTGPRPTVEEIRAAHEALDHAQTVSVTAADVRLYRKGV